MLELIKVSTALLRTVINREDCKPDNAIDFDKCNPAGGPDPEPCEPDTFTPCSPDVYNPEPCLIYCKPFWENR